MALLIDQTQQFDVEIVDDWMFVYSSRKLNLLDVPTMNHLFRIVDAVGAKTITRTDRYSDDRMSGRALNMVAPERRRLKRRWPVFDTFIDAALVVYWIWDAVAGSTGGT